MKIVEDFDEIDRHNYPVVTSGTFDGVHMGHQKILSDLSQQARDAGGESIVLTLWPHPRFVLGKDAGDLMLLSTFEEKADRMAACGIDYLLKVHFSRKFSELTSSEFIEKVLVQGLHTKKLIIGYDHRFGKDQEGSFEFLKTHQSQFGFEIQEIPRQDLHHVGISSTRIRLALGYGNVEEANEFLGYPYSLSGIVTKGDQIGRTIGFPTANIYLPEEYKLVPCDGVYAVRVRLNGENLDGMLNIGVRPTVEGALRRIEVNIFNFDREIYGQKIRVDFIKELRKEIRFNNLDELKNQLETDKIQAKKELQ